jgi:hypothetical protein
MKLRRIIFLMAFVTTACSSLSGLTFKIDTTSPQKTYRVVVEGRPDPPDMTATAQQVSLQVFKGSTLILSDGNFYREEVDHLFTDEYPAHEWLSDSVLRFGKTGSSAAAKEAVTIVNSTGDNIDAATVEYSILNDKFIVLGLPAGQSVELQLILTSDGVKEPNPMLVCTAFANGRSFRAFVNRWRRAASGNQLIGELSKS